MAEPQLLWDASGLVKRYYVETGSDTVNALFMSLSVERMTVTPWGYAETFSILLRKRNGGILSFASFEAAKNKLEAEVLGTAGFNILSIGDAVIFGSLSLMQAHNLNSADAAILSTLLRFQHALPTGSPSCLLVASDKRLVRAAEAEGLAALNPEQIVAGNVAALLAVR